MSAIDPPRCPICNAAHWSRFPHRFTKPLSAVTMAAKGILKNTNVDRGKAPQGEKRTPGKPAGRSGKDAAKPSPGKRKPRKKRRVKK